VNLWLLISVIIRAAAIAWAVVLWIRRRDLTLAFTVVLFIVMFAGLIGYLNDSVEQNGWFPLDTTPLAPYLMSIVTSALCITMVALFEASSRRDRRRAQDLSLLASALEESAEAAMITTAKLDGNGPVIVWTNDAACTLFGRTREELLGQSPLILGCGNAVPAVTALRERDTFEGESACPRRGGAEFRLQSIVSSVRTPSGERTHFLVLYRDVTRRHEAEEALRRSESLFRTVADTTPAMLWMSDRESNSVFLNRAWLEFCGGTLGSELVGGWQRVLHPDDRERAIRTYDESFAARCSFTMEYRLRRADDAYRLIVDRGYPRFTDTGEFDGFTGWCADVTDERAAAAALAESEAKYRQVVDSSPDAIAMHAEGKVVFVNATGLRLLGASSPDEVLGRPFLDFVHPEERPSSVDRARLILDSRRELRPTERRLLRLDGSTLEVELAAAPCMHRGRPAAMIFARDLSERKKAQRELSASQQRLSLLVRHSPMGAVVWDTEFRIVEWNPAAERMFGFSAAEAIGRDHTLIVPPEARPGVDTVLDALRTGSGGTHSSNLNNTRDGRRIHCEWYNSPLIDETGRVIGTASLVEDITERVRAEERQRLLMLELDHRVKNNLAVVISLAEHTLHTATSLPEFSEGFLGRVRALARMHTLLTQSRWKGAPLRELLERSLEAFTAGDRGRIGMVGPEVSLVTREATSINMVVHELATNAAKYGALTAPGGRVMIEWGLANESAGETLTLTWTEAGGPPAVPPARRGVGLTVIQDAIGYELGGKVDLQFSPGGVRCEIVIPRAGDRPQSRYDIAERDMLAEEVTS
jgi:PAS domain S-box-containing protein